jgi:5-methylcytosine-specific restriction endonuclease McrA
MGRRITARDRFVPRIWRENHPYSVWANNVRQQHKRRGIEVRLSRQELAEIAKTETAKKCAYCETHLDWTYGTKKGQIQDNSPTADRLNNEKFIDRNNIRIVCYRCNMGKGRWTLAEFISHCKRIAQLSEL